MLSLWSEKLIFWLIWLSQSWRNVCKSCVNYHFDSTGNPCVMCYALLRIAWEVFRGDSFRWARGGLGGSRGDRKREKGVFQQHWCSGGCLNHVSLIWREWSEWGRHRLRQQSFPFIRQSRRSRFCLELLEWNNEVVGKQWINYVLY